MVLKVAPGTSKDFVQKQKTNLEFQRIFDNPLAKYLFSKKLLEGIGYISSYLTKSEKHSILGLQNNFFKKKTLWHLFMDGI